MFLNNGLISKEPYIDNCIFSSSNENIDRDKLLKVKGHTIKVISKGEGIEVTQSSDVGSRTYSLKLKGFDNHTNVYVGRFNSDVMDQHFKRLRSHVTTKDNPNLIFNSVLIKDEEVQKSENKVTMYLRIKDAYLS